MHCANCAGKLRTALADAAARVDVTLDPPEIRLTDPKITDIEALRRLIAKAGAYTIDRKAVAVPTLGQSQAVVTDESEGWLSTYQPLLVITAYIALASFAGTGAIDSTDWSLWMSHFMAGFFLVFSAFKFLDLNGFADAYATYDLLAKRWHGYGFVYPFLELGLGLAYLFQLMPSVTNIATILLMGFSSLGVISALREKRTIQCACLGTVLKLPMSTITLVEDLGMAGMAAIALAASALAAH